MKRLEEMTHGELTAYCVQLARAIEDMLPPGPSAKGKCLFAIVFTHTEEPGMGQYIANAERSGVVAMLRQCADRIERREDNPR